jgi:NhaP-type Na+/H+ or K+/H+ antiporter
MKVPLLSVVIGAVLFPLFVFAYSLLFEPLEPVDLLEKPLAAAISFGLLAISGAGIGGTIGAIYEYLRRRRRR